MPPFELDGAIPELSSPQDGDVCWVPGSGSRCQGFHPLQSIREAAARLKIATLRQKKKIGGAGA